MVCCRVLLLKDGLGEVSGKAIFGFCIVTSRSCPRGRIRSTNGGVVEVIGNTIGKWLVSRDRLYESSLNRLEVAHVGCSSFHVGMQHSM